MPGPSDPVPSAALVLLAGAVRARRLRTISAAEQVAQEATLDGRPSRRALACLQDAVAVQHEVEAQLAAEEARTR
jgi:hypothetical protein